MAHPAEKDSKHKSHMFTILSNERRRMVLYYLYEIENDTTLDKLTNQITAWENNKSIDLIGSKERKAVYVSLYQTHIDKLQSVGFIDYTRDRIKLKEDALEAFKYLEYGPGEPPSYGVDLKDKVFSYLS